MKHVKTAVLYLVIATSLFSIINVIVKYLSHLPASEVVVFRGFTSLVLCSLLIWWKGDSFLGKNKRVLFLRGLFGTIALLSFFSVIQNVPLAVAMTFINLSPIFTVIIAHLVLGEKANLGQWILLLLSFVGVFLVRGEVTPVPLFWMVVGLASGFFAGAAYTCVRYLRLSEDPLVVILYFPLVTLPLVSPLAIMQWQTPQGIEWLMLVAIGVLTQVAQYYMTLAYQMETAAKVMIFNYTGLFWGVLLGYALFDETLSWQQMMGIVLVFLCLCANFFVSQRKPTRV